MDRLRIYILVIHTGLEVAQVGGQLLGPSSALVVVSTLDGTLHSSISTVKYKDDYCHQRFGPSENPPKTCCHQKLCKTPPNKRHPSRDIKACNKGTLHRLWTT